MSHIETSNPVSGDPNAEKIRKELPEGVDPQSAYWYTKTGGIEALNSGELIVLGIDYKAWSEKKPVEAGRYDAADYCRFRQRCHALKTARRFAKAPS